MKKLSLLLTLLLAISFTSCDKQEEPQMNRSINDPNATGGSGNNGGGNNQTTWNWSGTAPFSVKVDGVDFAVDVNSVTVTEALGLINITLSDATGDISVGLSIPSSVEDGKEYPMPSPCNITYTDYANSLQLIAKSGAVKIISITATEVEGLFQSDLYDAVGGTSQTKKLTEGYFKVTRSFV